MVCAMNMQKRSDERSRALHREIAKKPRNNPTLWSVPKDNIERWKKEGKGLVPSVAEWEYILGRYAEEEILALLEGASEESVRPRCGTGATNRAKNVEALR